MSILSEYQLLQDLLKLSNEKDTQEHTVSRMYMDSVFESQCEKREYVDSITILDKKFKIVACSEYVSPGEVSVLKEVDLSNLKKEVLFSSVIEPGARGNKKKCLIATKAIYDKEEVIGYLVEEINLLFFERIRLSVDLLKNGTLYLTDENGTIITAGTKTETREEYILEEEDRSGFSEAWEQREITDGVGVIEYEILGKTYLSSYSGFKNANWKILATVCLDDILKTKESYQRIFWVMAALLGILILAVNLIFSRVLLFPIDRMLQKFSIIKSRKDYSIRLDEVKYNELGIISKEVNELLFDIELTIKNQSERLKYLKNKAERDPLTDLFNKKAIEEIISLKIQNARVDKTALACVLIDIDDFKEFNTKYGHVGGDKVIQFIAAILKETSADMAGRIGGDEFIMCLECTEGERVFRQKIDLMLEQMKKGLLISTIERIPVSCSVGISILTPQIESSYETLLILADKAMYEVKNSSKNGYVISEKHDTFLTANATRYT